MRRWRFLFAGAKYLIAGAFAAGAFVATSAAVNADGMAKAPQVVQQAPTSWSGLYFGVHSGWQWSTDVNVQNPAFPPGFTVDHDSPVVGGQIGIQHQFGQIVVGVEGSLTTTYQNNPGDAPCPAAGSTCSARLDDVLSVGPRIGWAMGKWMPYVTGGYANAAYHFVARTNGTQVQVEEARARLNGWYIGGGVDMALSHGWMVGLEYRHYDFDPKIASAFSPTGLFLEPARFDASSDMVTLRVSWKFDRPERVVAPPLK
jgi:outer membrane immunogenic protein